MTGLMGRWQELQANPKVICDIGHNVGAWEINKRMLLYESERRDKTFIIIGISEDKDINGMLSLMPANAIYYFTQADSKRALPAEELAKKAAFFKLTGSVCPTVHGAIKEALQKATANDFVLISGSTFVVGEALELYPDKQL